MRGLALLCFTLLAGCASPFQRERPLPAALASEAEIPGIPNARYWGDERPEDVDAWLTLPKDTLRARYGEIMDQRHDYLVLSGGGDDGAFGAGLLVGWSDAGTRPEFQIVTGISTGALIAPFAFLGSDYDALLREIYTGFSTKDILRLRGPLQILRGDAVTSDRPLRRKIAEYLDEDVIAQIAAESRHGRNLLIGTTNLDAGRPVIWNITRIAASGSPRATSLIHDVILASASIPGVFPPVLIEVEAEGRRFNELHVDGGVTTQLFFWPAGTDWQRIGRSLGIHGEPRLYIIRNDKLRADWKTVKRRLLPIMHRTIDTTVRTQGIGDVRKLLIMASAQGLDYRLTFIPTGFDAPSDEPFDPAYMRRLFQLGYRCGRSGHGWLNPQQILGSEMRPTGRLPESRVETSMASVRSAPSPPCPSPSPAGKAAREP